MVIIDAQVHAYEANHPSRPWTEPNTGPPAVTGDDQVAAMDQAGVDAAILVSPWKIYRYDPSYAVEVCAAHPSRFRVVAPIDPSDAAPDERVAAWANTPGAVGIRLIAGKIQAFRADDHGVRDTIRAAARHGFPISVYCSGKLSIIEQLARLYPDAQFVLDHIGIPHPLKPPPPDRPFAELDRVLALAQFPNVAIKVTGACALSHEGYPFDDIWQPLARLFEAFGIQRCMWGTDWTRALDFVNYPESVAAFRDRSELSPDDRKALMGGTAQTIFGWSAD